MPSRDTQSGLPAPDTDALEHSERLRAHIVRAIDAAGGTLPFSQFMNMALYEPGLGYYSAGSVKFGSGGDFITAADLGDFLARTIAATLAPRLARMPKPAVVELGAGSGVLAADLLRQFDQLGLGHVEYRILEPSAQLRARQQRRLAHERTRVTWIERLEPGSVTGAIIANEVADALPVERIVRSSHGWQQLDVAHDGGRFRWSRQPLSAAAAEALAATGPELTGALPQGYVTELRPLLAPWIAALAAALADGEILIIDYGMSARELLHPQRDGGTLMCHYRHRAHTDPFLWPGLQDITAWVDFSDCARAGSRAGLRVGGYTTQGGWIAESLLPDARLDRLDAAGAARLKTLLLPGEMGERFKVLLLSRNLGHTGAARTAADAAAVSDDLAGDGVAGDAWALRLPGRDLRGRL